MRREIVVAAGGLQVRFFPEGDRFAHQIERSETADVSQRVIACSLEGTADDAWPASPPLQEVHLETRPGGVQVALAVGMAGCAHWSASVAADPASGTIEFDVACRTHQRPDWLGSQYQILRSAGGAAASTAAGWVLYQPNGAPIAWPPPSAAQVRMQPEELDVAYPATIRWGYRFVAVGDS